MNQLKYAYKKRDLQFQLHIELILKSILLVWIWVLQGRLDLHFYNFFKVVFLMVWLYQCVFFLFFKFWICALTFRSIDTSNLPRLVNLSTYYVLIAFPVIKSIAQLTYCVFSGIFSIWMLIQFCLIFKASLQTPKIICVETQQCNTCSKSLTFSKKLQTCLHESEARSSRLLIKGYSNSVISCDNISTDQFLCS